MYVFALIVFKSFTEGAARVQSAIPVITLRRDLTYDFGCIACLFRSSWVGRGDNAVFE